MDGEKFRCLDDGWNGLPAILLSHQKDEAHVRRRISTNPNFTQAKIDNAVIICRGAVHSPAHAAHGELDTVSRCIRAKLWNDLSNKGVAFVLGV